MHRLVGIQPCPMPTFLEYGWSIAIDPSYISKSGKKTPHIGTFWSGCASSMKHGLEIMGLALVDVYANSCMMLRAHQTPSTGELKLRNMTLVQHYIAVIKRYKKDLLKVTDIVVADAFFSIRPFVDGIKEYGSHLVSRFRDTAGLYYVYTGPRSHKLGRPKTLDGKIDYKKLGVSRFLVGINFRHPNVMPNFAVWKTITYRHWHRWCCQPRF